MKKSILPSTMLLLAVLAAGSLWAAQGYRDFYPLMLDTRETELFSVSGYVRDEFNGKGVGFAVVRLDGVGGNFATKIIGSTGFFRFTGLDPAQFPQHQSRLSAQHSGYLDSAALIGIQPGTNHTLLLKSKTVILLHGFCGSYFGTWGGDDGPFATALSEEGFDVVGVDIGEYPINVMPVSTARDNFRSALESNCHQRGIQSYDVIAHSMGGIVARYYATKNPEDRKRINKLVTLGTPHHGTQVANFILSTRDDPALWGVYLNLACSVDLNEISLPVEDSAAVDLAVDSVFLNSLNYNEIDVVSSDCETDFVEETDHHSTTLFSIAGTAPGGPWTFTRLFLPCALQPSDGFVLTSRAYYHNGHKCTDTGLGCSGTHHKNSDGGLAKSVCIAEKVVDLLKNGAFDCSVEDHEKNEGVHTSSLPLIEQIVQPGATYTDSTAIDAISVADFLCVSTADSLAYTLTSPSGRVIDPEECELDPDLEYSSSSGAVHYSIRNPEPGLWMHSVRCIDSTGPESVMIMATFDGDVVLAAETTSGIDPDGAFILHASLTDAGTPIPTGAVTAMVRSPDGSTEQIDLFDDGFGNDAFAGDGIYSATYPAGGEVGIFGFRFHGDTDPGGPQSEHREALRIGTAAWLPDLAIGESGLEVSATTMPIGGVMELSASFTNRGAATADSVLITLSNVSYNQALAETLLIDMAPGQTVVLQTQWLAVAEGSFRLRAGIDLIGEQTESSFVNNGSELEVTVFVPGGVSSVPGEGSIDGPDGASGSATSRVLLHSSFPNPLASGSTSIRFQVPQVDAQVDLAVFDVRGRRIKLLMSGVLPQGEHVRAWDGSDCSGRQVASGIYFCRLQVAGEVQIKKMVVVR